MTQAEFGTLGHEVLRVALSGGVLPWVIRTVSVSPPVEKVIERPDVLAVFGEGAVVRRGQHDDGCEGGLGAAFLGREDGSEGEVRGRDCLGRSARG